MPNRIVIWCASLHQYIAPRLNEPYHILVGSPKKVGDEAIIWVEGMRRRVMLVEVTDTVKPALWLVDRGPA